MPDKEKSSKNEDKSSDEKSNSKHKTDPHNNTSASNEPEKYPIETVIFYGVAFFLCCSYGVFAYDKNAFSAYAPLQPLVTLFEKLEHFSPFIETYPISYHLPTIATFIKTLLLNKFDTTVSVKKSTYLRLIVSC